MKTAKRDVKKGSGFHRTPQVHEHCSGAFRLAERAAGLNELRLFGRARSRRQVLAGAVRIMWTPDGRRRSPSWGRHPSWRGLQRGEGAAEMRETRVNFNLKHGTSNRSVHLSASSSSTANPLPPSCDFPYPSPPSPPPPEPRSLDRHFNLTQLHRRDYRDGDQETYGEERRSRTRKGSEKGQSTFISPSRANSSSSAFRRGRAALSRS